MAIIFNKEDTNFSLSMEDVKHLNHNLYYKVKNDFMDNYSWEENTKLYIKHKEASGIWNDKEISVYQLYTKWHLGYAIIVDGKVEHLIGIYEPHGCSLNVKRGLFTCHGHEEIITMWLEDGELEHEMTR